MMLHRVSLVMAVATVVTSTVIGESNSGSGRVFGDISGSDSGATQYLPVEVVQSQLLNASGLAPDSIVAVSSNYTALQENSPGIGNVTTPNTNVFASVLIVPDASTDASGPSFESTPADGLSGRTQLTYNCTTAANLWDLLADTNVLKLEAFQQVGPTEVNDSSISGLGDNTTEGSRTVVATVSIQVANCVLAQDSSVGRPVIGNAFFDPKFESDPVYFYTASSAVVDTKNHTDAASSEGCVLELQMLRANLTEVYPSCKIKFQSTDLNNLGLSAGTTTTSSASPNATASSTTRRLDASSFGFLRNPKCSYECGDGGADPDQCYALVDAEWIFFQCTIQFYTENSACNSECGDKVGFPLYEDPLPPNQCYDCYETIWWCDSKYYAANAAGCCRVLTCPAISDTTMTRPADLKWNLEDDKTTISDPSLVLFEDGDCSDRSDPRSDCCRITCEDCYVLISVASLYADVDAFALNDYTTTAEMKLVGSSELKVKIFAPNGCRLTLTENIFDETATIPLSTGIDLEIQVALDILRELRLQPHGTSVEFGVVTEIEGLTGGYVDSEEFFDLQITSRPADDLAQSGIDIELELDVIPTVRASLSLLGGTAKIGVKATIAVFVELEAGIQFPIFWFID